MRTAALFFLGYMLMAKPPDGSSTWFHHADTFTLSERDGQTWLRVSVPVSGGQLDVTVPEVGNPWNHSYVLSLSADAKLSVACVAGYAGTSATPVKWTADTPPERLLPRERQVRARTSSPPGEAGPVVAQVHAEKGGRLWFTDPRGKARLELRLHRPGDPPTGMKLVTSMTQGGRPVVDVFALADKQFPVTPSQSSLP